MFDYKNSVTESGLVLLPLSELIELLEFKLDSLKQAKQEDSSWNYPIDELTSDIDFLKKKCN